MFADCGTTIQRLARLVCRGDSADAQRSPGGPPPSRPIAPSPRLCNAAVVTALAFAAAAGYVTVAAPPAAGAQAFDLAAALARDDLDRSSRMRLELLEMVNTARAEAGMPAYALDARLTASAGAHAADMAANRFCRHTGSDGSSAKSRIAHHGYPLNNWAGENIMCSRWTPQQAMRWWMSSGPHRRNILHAHYTHIGIGYDPHGRYGPVWTLNFAAGAPDTITPAFAVVPESLPTAGPQPF